MPEAPPDRVLPNDLREVAACARVVTGPYPIRPGSAAPYRPVSENTCRPPAPRTISPPRRPSAARSTRRTPRPARRASLPPPRSADHFAAPSPQRGTVDALITQPRRLRGGIAAVRRDPTEPPGLRDQ